MKATSSNRLRIVMIDHGIERQIVVERMPAGVRLAVDHDNGVFLGPDDFFNGMRSTLSNSTMARFSARL